MKIKLLIPTLSTFLLTTIILQQSTTPIPNIPMYPPGHYLHNLPDHKIYAHSRFHILPSPDPSNRQVFIQSCSKRKFENAVREKRKYDYSGNPNAIAFRRLSEAGKITDEVMEVSFHFGEEVEDYFIKKFEHHFAGLKGNEKLELFYGFNKEIQPVVRNTYRTEFLEDGTEMKFQEYDGNLRKDEKMDFFNVSVVI